MNQTVLRHLSALVLVPAVALTAAYAFGSNGYEGFLTLSLWFGTVLTVQVFELMRQTAAGTWWLPFKFIAGMSLAFFWFICSMIVMFTITSAGHDPRVPVPSVNWLIVFLLLAVYAAAFWFRPQAQSETAPRLPVQLIVSLYSIVFMFMAETDYFLASSRSGGHVLILAAQLQYILSYLVFRLNYVQRSVAFINRFSAWWPLAAFQTQSTLLLAGLPFFIPIVILAIIK